MNRRDFFKLGAAFGAGAALSKPNAAGSPIVAPGAGIPQGGMVLPENPAFKTKHLVTIILGNGARKIDVIDNDEHSPHQSKMIREGTLFTEDYGETANLHGYMYTEVLTGRDAPAQRPLYPTWNEYVRKKTGGKASDFWMLQGASYYRAWTWDVKHFSRHPEYGIGFGATSLTMNKIFYPENQRSPREIVDTNVEMGLGHTASERKRIEDWIADVLKARAYEFPSTREPVIDRQLQIGDCQALHLAGRILKDFKPKMITVQVLALDDAHADFGFWDYNTDYWEYIKHIKTTDELIGNLWAGIQADPYLRETTSLLIRPECGRDDEVNIYGQLGHSPGNYYAHYVWMSALGPDFKKGHVVRERVQRRDLVPTITYLMSGENAEYATGHVRTQLFRDEYRMPDYVLPPTADVREPVINWEAIVEERRTAERIRKLARSTVGYGD
jgi:hypothetical protein